MSSKNRKRKRASNNRRYKQTIYPNDTSNDSDSPKTKKVKIKMNNSKRKLISEENRIKQILKRSSVLLHHIEKKKFIEVGLVFDGKAYSMIKGNVGTNGTMQTRNFKSKAVALNGALKLLTNKVRNGYNIIEEEIEIEDDSSSSSTSSSSSEESESESDSESDSDVNSNKKMENDTKVKVINKKPNKPTMNFTPIKNVKPKIKHLVYGFIRQHADFSVPDVIKNGCLLYFWSIEQFQESDTIKVLTMDIAINKCDSVSYTTGIYVINFHKNFNCVVEWIFKVDCDDCGIGLTSDEKAVSLCYGWHNGGHLFSMNGSGSQQQMNILSSTEETFSIGDNIRMVLDCNTKLLKYYKNDQSTNVSFNIDEKYDYKMSILMNGSGSIHILYFNVIKEQIK